MIDRRELLQRAAVMLGGAVSSSAVMGILSGCATAPAQEAAAAPGKTRFFTAEEAKTAAAMAEQIIPKTDTLGAIDVGVPAFMDRMMADFYQDDERAIVRAGLARADQEAKAAHGKPFAALTAEQQIAIMTVYDREAYQFNRLTGANPAADHHFFRTMKELTTLGYFTSEYGASKFLQYAPVPGKLRSDVPYSEIGKAWAT